MWQESFVEAAVFKLIRYVYYTIRVTDSLNKTCNISRFCLKESLLRIPYRTFDWKSKQCGTDDSTA